MQIIRILDFPSISLGIADGKDLVGLGPVFNSNFFFSVLFFFLLSFLYSFFGDFFHVYYNYSPEVSCCSLLICTEHQNNLADG